MLLNNGKFVVLVSFSICYTLSLKAGDGIRFSLFHNWKEVQARAKAENKYIFLDCYATWCGPCKKMDRTTYQANKIGDFVQDRFICVRVQMDTTNQDDDFVKSWYSDVNLITHSYGINVYPSFLFFSPDGKIIHRDCGYKNETEFLNVLSASLDPQRQIYTLIRNYQLGKKDYANMPYLVDLVRRLGDEDFGRKLAIDYIDNFLCHLNDGGLYTKENLEFIGSAITSSSENGFKVLYGNEARVDQVMARRMFAEKIVDNIIYQEEIYLDMAKDEKLDVTPDWQSVADRIIRKYDKKHADRVIINARIYWYNRKKDWSNLVKYWIDKIRYEGMDTTKIGMMITNDFIYKIIVMHSNDTDVLQKALQWEKSILDKYTHFATFFDTYANLLYKLGRGKEALEWEQKAFVLDSNDPEILNNYNKMKKGEPTWVVFIIFPIFRIKRSRQKVT